MIEGLCGSGSGSGSGSGAGSGELSGAVAFDAVAVVV
jgi:hypothetical protein